MKIYAFSDTHISTGIKAPLMKFLMEVEDREPDYLIGCGDIFEAARVGWKELVKMDGFLELSAILSKIATRGKTKVMLIEGNHDFDLHKYSQYFANVLIHKTRCNLGPYRLTHGWKELDWLLKWIPSWFYRLIFPLFPRWQWLYDKLVNRSRKLLGNPVRRENKLYWKFVKGMHDRAMDLAMDKECRVIFGHTHEPSVRYFPEEYDGWVVANCGDFCDSNTALIIEDHKIIRWKA